MNMPICSRCKKNIAMVFVARMDGDKTTNEGLCLKCARDLGIKPVGDMMDKFGISDEDVENMAKELSQGGEMLEGLMRDMGQLSQVDDIDDEDDADEPDEQPSRAPAFPLFNMFDKGRKSEPEEPVKSDPARKATKKEEKARKFLRSYALNLTERARDGKLDRIVGRDRETERVIQILNRRQKNNPCLIGEPGVGKTAVAEGLAQRIAAGNVPHKLQNKAEIGRSHV